MPDIPPPPQVGLETLARWHAAKQELAKAQFKERELRLQIFGHYFPNPKEGTNTFVLPDLYQLKAVLPISRDYDLAALSAARTPDASGKNWFQKNNFDETRLIKWIPELALAEYRMLTAEEAKKYDTLMTIKAGTPQVKIEDPAKKGVNTKPSPEPTPRTEP